MSSSRALTDHVVRAAPRLMQPLHRHGDWRVIVFLDGVTEEGAFGEWGRFERADFILRPAFSAHTDRTDAAGAAYVRLHISARARRVHLAIHGWKAVRGRADPDSLDLPSRARAATGGDDLLTLAGETAYRPVPFPSPLHALAAQMGTAVPPRLDRAAEQLGLAPYQLTRRFIRMFGLPPQTYRRQARLQRAMAMLAAGAESLSQIATAAGFYDQSHLSRELKRETGLTPRGFAAACR